jgi:hypothetical protein
VCGAKETPKRSVSSAAALSARTTSANSGTQWLYEAFAAIRAGYDLRIVFEIAKRSDNEVILLISVGTHDEVY